MAKRRYSAEFRAALNKQIEASGYSAEQVAEYLRVSAQVLNDWLQESGDECPRRTNDNNTIEGIRAELARAKAELRLANEERQILRKIAMLYANKRQR